MRDWSKRQTRQGQNNLQMKSLQFLGYHHETWSKGPLHRFVILTKFHDDSSKIVDFLLMDNFLTCLFFWSVSMSNFIPFWRKMLKFFIIWKQSWFCWICESVGLLWVVIQSNKTCINNKSNLSNTCNTLKNFAANFF